MIGRNVFQTGEVNDDVMVGYRHYYEDLAEHIESKIQATGGIYVYGLDGVGKTSVVKRAARIVQAKHPDLVYVYIELGKFSGGDERERFVRLLMRIVRTLRNCLIEREGDYSKVLEAIERFESSRDTMDFEDVFDYVAAARLDVLLVVDDFDEAKNVFLDRSNFEIFRSLTSSSMSHYPPILLTVSKQELGLIENENPNNSPLKGVMQQYPIKGFDEGDLEEYYRRLKEYYEYEPSERDREKVRFYAGDSPRLLSRIGYEVAECKLHGIEVNMDSILASNTILNACSSLYSSILKRLSHDVDYEGVSLADKLISTVIGPSLLATRDDVRLLEDMHYVVKAGDRYVAFSGGFNDYLRDKSLMSNDILKNFYTLEKRLKVLLDAQKSSIFKMANANDTDEDKNWYDVLFEVWRELEHRKFNETVYENQINGTMRRFDARETVLNVMSLEDVVRIIRYYWTLFSKYFGDDTLGVWEDRLVKCGVARNPVHHGSYERLYSKEEVTEVNAYCSAILKRVS